MPDPEPRSRSRFKTPAIILAISAVLVLLSIGLCNAGHFNFEGSSSSMANAGVLFFFAGVFGGLVSIIWLFIALIMNSFASK